MTKLNRAQKSLLLGSLVALVLVMGIAYAAFGTQLNISGTSKIDSKWDIEIISITPNKEASCTNKEDISTCTTVGDVTSSVGDNKLSASFNAALISPGDTVTYTITVQNKGNLDAKLDTISKTPSTNNAIQINESGIKEGTELKANTSKIFTIEVSYDNSVTSQPADTSASFTITLNFVQADGTSSSGGSSDVTTTIEDLKTLAVSNGNGLYEDTTESGRYIYRGANPNNYICLGNLNLENKCPSNSLYRIISTESDGTLKVIKNTSIGNFAYDTANNRSAEYCDAAEYGCNVWGSSSTMYKNGSAITAMPRRFSESETNTYALPSDVATLNTSLNGSGFYNNLSSKIKGLIKEHYFNNGPLAYVSGQNISTDVSQEAAYKWKGNVGLMNITDYVRASTNSACTSVYTYNSDSNCYNNGATHNWLFPLNTATTRSTNEWSLSPDSNSTPGLVWNVHSSGNVSYSYARGTLAVRPVFYLSPDIVLNGDGSSGNPYQIES